MKPTLAHTVITSANTTPSKYMIFAHGILGTRANWRTIARRFTDKSPGWGAILVDLREHGGSRGFSPPHTVTACVEDLITLQDQLVLPITGILGHSFGGKVALQWAKLNRGARQVWVVDSTPGTREALGESSGVLEVLQSLEKMPINFDSRRAFVEAVVRAGHPERTAQWLAMNLAKSVSGARHLNLDLKAIREMLTDYANLSLWGVLDPPRVSTNIHWVVGGKSAVVNTEDQARIAELSQRYDNLTFDTIADAGHWVHADNPDALIALIAEKC